jgi:SulP family sulfate permease
VLSRLADLFRDQADRAAFIAYLEKVDFPEGDLLIRQGERPNDVLFLEQGEVSVYLESRDGTRARLRRTGRGTVIGEIGFYLDSPRSASVIADKPGTAYRLTREALA